MDLIRDRISVFQTPFLCYSFLLFQHTEIEESTRLCGRRGRVDDLSFFEYLSAFCFLSIEFHCTFLISYKILSYFVYYCSDKLFSCFFDCLSQGISHGM